MSQMQAWPVISARRFELYVRWSLYFLMAVLPIQMAGMVAGAAADRMAFLETLGLLALSLVVTVFNVRAARWSLDGVMRERRPFPAWFVVGWALSLLAVSAGLMWVLADIIPMALILLIMPSACAVSAISPSLTFRTTAIVTGAAIVVGAAIAASGAVEVLIAVLLFAFVVWTAWSSGWMLSVLRQLQQAHDTAAQLSVAEERLRISRDLHDVFGRTLATISVKSELAAELSRRGHHDRAADEMKE
ncbi:MAG: histidine kinase dimerization/phosphoacceptor domain-containing protein, partial [Propionibacteriaceae bacterium]|nr:histidine kinase dimerization/phosphoacceptor domain-containing protein [Propionibacteriaceae bacterium]